MDPEEIFEKGNFFSESSTRNSEDTRLEVINGIPRMVRYVTYESVNPDGSKTTLMDQQFLCDHCGGVWVQLGVNGKRSEERVLCRKCARRMRIKKLTKPLWSPFIKMEE